jgi:hypothetical protein
MEVIHINKNGQKVLLDDYLYTNNLLGRITYIGHMRKVVQSHCKWSLKTFLALDKPVSDASHNHEPDPASVCVTKANPNLNRPERNQVTSLPWRSLIFPMMPNYVWASMIPWKRWYVKLEGARHPFVPDSSDEFTSDGDWAQAVQDDPESFVIIDNGPD